MTSSAITLPSGYERRLPLDPLSPCWEWTGVVRQHGYGVLTIDGAERYAHRLAYHLHVGPIPRGWEIDHVCHGIAVDCGTCEEGGACRHRRCWNPAHLEAITAYENARRGVHRNRLTQRSEICRNGHDLTIPSNVYRRGDGRKQCAVCSREGRRRRRAEGKAS